MRSNRVRFMSRGGLPHFVAAVALVLASGAAAAACTAESGARRVPLLELYTSEGCSSCPPADRWVSGLPGRGLRPERVVALAFHVDYWNHLGWADRFAKPEYSARQRAASQRARARFVYTPQLLLNGKDYRRATFRDDFHDRVEDINRETAQASIGLQLRERGPLAYAVSGAATLRAPAADRAAHAYVALYENDLANHVTAGENRGRRLRHDFVVRALAGPFRVNQQGGARFDHVFHLDPGWKRRDLHIAAFVQNDASGEVLQALALGLCPSP